MDEQVDLKYKSWIAIVGYLIGFYLIGSIVTVVAIRYFSTDFYSYNVILDALNNGTEDPELKKLCAYSSSLSNGIIYFMITLFLLIFMAKIYKNDAIKFKENWKKNIAVIIIGGILFFAVSYTAGLFIEKLTDNTSANQASIESSFNYRWCAIVMSIVTILGGPIVEEMVFRKSIFNLTSKYHKAVAIIISALLFSLPHMVSTKGVSVGDWFLLLIPYLISGVGLGLIYEYSGENIYVSMSIHLINNLVAVILIFVGL